MGGLSELFSPASMQEASPEAPRGPFSALLCDRQASRRRIKTDITAGGRVPVIDYSDASRPFARSNGLEIILPSAVGQGNSGQNPGKKAAFSAASPPRPDSAIQSVIVRPWSAASKKKSGSASFFEESLRYLPGRRVFNFPKLRDPRRPRSFR